MPISQSDSSIQQPRSINAHNALSLRFTMDILDLSELVTVAQDQVHVFVERFERADEDSPVLQDTAHPEVDVLQHLTALTDRLEHKQDERVKNNIKDTDASYEHWPADAASE